MTDPQENPIVRWLTEKTGPLLGWFFSVTGDRNRADDLFQEVCLEVWRHRGRIRQDQDLGAFVHAVARNVLMRDRRRQARNPSVAWNEATEALDLAWLPRLSRPPEDGSAERAHALAQCVSTLDPSQRDILRRLYHDRASHDVVAE